MSSASKASTPKGESSSSRLKSLGMPLIVVAVVVLISFAFGYLQATVVNGSEFDTGTWTVRSFWYRRDPFTGRQITGILRDASTTIMTRNATFPNSYFGKKPAKPARWDLIELRSGTAVTKGPARVLMNYLEGYTGEQFWPDWSTNNTAKADILWPAVKDLVDLGLYYALPEIMELSTVDSTDAEFKSMVFGQMTSIIKEHCEKLRSDKKSVELEEAESVFENYATSDFGGTSK